MKRMSGSASTESMELRKTDVTVRGPVGADHAPDGVMNLALLELDAALALDLWMNDHLVLDVDVDRGGRGRLHGGRELLGGGQAEVVCGRRVDVREQNSATWRKER